MYPYDQDDDFDPYEDESEASFQAETDAMISAAGGKPWVRKNWQEDVDEIRELTHYDPNEWEWKKQ